MPTPCYVHPEFGYFCPSPQLRRWLRIALAAISLGTIIAIVVLPTGQDSSSDSARGFSGSDPMAVAAEPHVAETKGTPSDAVNIQTVHIRFELNREAAQVAVKSEDYGKAGANKTECEDNTWAYLDGRCATAGKPRWVRVRAVTDNPAIASVSLGRRTVPLVSADAPPQSSPEEPAPAKAATATPESTVAAKKPQRTVRSQNRHLREAYAYQRADYWGSYAHSNNRGGALWVWSRGW